MLQCLYCQYDVDYKSKKMEKLLAALALPQVGTISVIPIDKDPEGQAGLFALELNERNYTLRAKSDEEAHQWVDALIKLKEQGKMHYVKRKIVLFHINSYRNCCRF